ncbi:hypothetical protein TCAL_06610 [Tigriopus californicus]|uniref:Uncharacterized protein n=1 Tax=Tigriopus californicus TaxID=6832 RepID=A0A553PLU1_TIGCA|nr:hypothetical protein TCAL_06610 [Tigriopus californicus]
MVPGKKDIAEAGSRNHRQYQHEHNGAFQPDHFGVSTHQDGCSNGGPLDLSMWQVWFTNALLSTIFEVEVNPSLPQALCQAQSLSFPIHYGFDRRPSRFQAPQSCSKYFQRCQSHPKSPRDDIPLRL